MIRAWYSNQFDRPDFNVHDMPVGHTDIRRLRQGMLGGQFWSAYVPWWVSNRNRSGGGRRRAS